MARSRRMNIVRRRWPTSIASISTRMGPSAFRNKVLPNSAKPQLSNAATRRVNVTNHLLLTMLLTAAASPALPQSSAPPPKGPQPVSRAVYMSRVDIAFNGVDTNKDGFTDRAEIEAAEREAMAARKEQLIKQRETAFRQLDKDKNGSLTLAEFNG